MTLERIRLEATHLWRRLTGAKDRARATAMHDFRACVAAPGPQDVAIDLGANVGLFTREMAATGAKVYAFEPDPHAFSRLSEALSGYDNVTLIQAAAGTEDGQVSLFRHQDFDQSPDLRSTGSSIISGKRRMDESRAIAVQTVDFVRFLRDLGRPVALLKIDIEGAEVPLLERLLSAPEAALVARAFVETHERVLLQLAPRTRALKARAAAMRAPVINWDWH